MAGSAGGQRLWAALAGGARVPVPTSHASPPTSCLFRLLAHPAQVINACGLLINLRTAIIRYRQPRSLDRFFRWGVGMVGPQGRSGRCRPGRRQPTGTAGPAPRQPRSPARRPITLPRPPGPSPPRSTQARDQRPAQRLPARVCLPGALLHADRLHLLPAGRRGTGVKRGPGMQPSLTAPPPSPPSACPCVPAPGISCPPAAPPCTPPTRPPAALPGARAAAVVRGVDRSTHRRVPGPRLHPPKPGVRAGAAAAGAAAHARAQPAAHTCAVGQVRGVAVQGRGGLGAGSELPCAGGC